MDTTLGERALGRNQTISHKIQETVDTATQRSEPRRSTRRRAFQRVLEWCALFSCFAVALLLIWG
jgi:hypothetical protein